MIPSNDCWLDLNIHAIRSAASLSALAARCCMLILSCLISRQRAATATAAAGGGKERLRVEKGRKGREERLSFARTGQTGKNARRVAVVMSARELRLS